MSESKFVMVSQAQIKSVLEALGEEFLVDVPALHDGKGSYLIDYFELAHRFVDPEENWVERIQGYVNAKALESIEQF